MAQCQRLIICCQLPADTALPQNHIPVQCLEIRCISTAVKLHAVDQLVVYLEDEIFMINCPVAPLFAEFGEMQLPNSTTASRQGLFPHLEAPTPAQLEAPPAPGSAWGPGSSLLHQGHPLQ